MEKKRNIKSRIRVQGFLIAVSVVMILLLPQFMFVKWHRELWDEFFDILGILTILSGYFLRVAARGHKKDCSKEGKALVLDGPYGLIRNPMYMGSFMIGAGLIILLFNPWVMLIFIAVIATIYIPHFKKEEDELVARFKDEYKDYVLRTPSLFPKPGQLFRLREYVTVKKEWLKNERLSFLFVFVMIFAVETWQDFINFGNEELVKEPFELLCAFILYCIFSFYLKSGKKPGFGKNGEQRLMSSDKP